MSSSLEDPTSSEESSGGSRPGLLRWVLVAFALTLVVGAASWRMAQSQRWLDDVVVYDYAAGLHTTSPLRYEQSPPVGGPHNPVWQNCGVFDVPVSDVHAVHSLEHGAVWVTYREDLLASEELQAMVRIAERSDYVILAPYPEQEYPVVLTAWNHQLALEVPSADQVARFVAYFANALSAPEPGAPCSQGVDTTRETSPSAPGPTMPPDEES